MSKSICIEGKCDVEGEHRETDAVCAIPSDSLLDIKSSVRQRAAPRQIEIIYTRVVNTRVVNTRVVNTRVVKGPEAICISLFIRGVKTVVNAPSKISAKRSKSAAACDIDSL